MAARYGPDVPGIVDCDSSAGIATGSVLIGAGIEFQWIRYLLHPSRLVLGPTQRSIQCRSQWPSGLRRRSAAARLLGLRVRIPPGAWMCVVHFVSERQEEKCRTVKTKTQVQLKSRVRENTEKEIPVTVYFSTSVQTSPGAHSAS